VIKVFSPVEQGQKIPLGDLR